ncbi:MAG: hypothetical protein GY855_05245 [candidate division Zixibacteria bacterium]|nr:hypothetical protein [candidate division Zixibacteria bacterium]
MKKSVLIFLLISIFSFVQLFADTLDPDPPVITDISHYPEHPEVGERVAVTATITDDGYVDHADLRYQIDFDHFVLPMDGLGNYYVASILGQPHGTILYYYIIAWDDEGDSTLSDSYSFSWYQVINMIPLMG